MGLVHLQAGTQVHLQAGTQPLPYRGHEQLSWNGSKTMAWALPSKPVHAVEMRPEFRQLHGSNLIFGVALTMLVCPERTSKSKCTPVGVTMGASGTEAARGTQKGTTQERGQKVLSKT